MNRDDEPWGLYKKSVKRFQASKPTVGSDKTTARVRARRAVKTDAHITMEDFKGPTVSASEANVGKTFTLVRAKKTENMAAPSTGVTTEKEVRLDRKTERAVRAGEIEIDAKLDLHGKTEREAYTALNRFIEKAVGAGHKWVLVVTGKGREGKAVLRSNFPRWCAEEKLSPWIMTLKQASPKHGGEGAFYVRLRKRKKP